MSRALGDLIAEIRETHRMHQQLLRAERRLEQQVQAIERRVESAFGSAGQSRRELLRSPAGTATLSPGAADQRWSDAQKNFVGPSGPLLGDAGHKKDDTHLPSAGAAALATIPLRAAQAGIAKEQRKLRRRLEKLAAQLPIDAFVNDVKGLGWFSVAQIIGEAGDLAGYATPSKLWKRMGLAVADGQAERRRAGEFSGYSPTRRSMMHIVGTCLLKKQNVFRELYLARKVVEQGKVPDSTKLLWHRRSMRYVEKRLLREMWRVWRHEVQS